MTLLTRSQAVRWYALPALLGFSAAVAGPLPASAVPEPLRPWVPWVMHGAEMLACPTPFNDASAHTCVWPSQLEVQAGPRDARFKFEIHVFGSASAVELPGEAEQWPQDVKADGQPVPVSQHGARPIVRLPPGKHVVTGTIAWAQMPQFLPLPVATGSIRLWVDGVQVDRTADSDGRIWLKQAASQARSTDAISVRTSRLVDDDIPLRVTTHYELAISGKPREVQLEFALLAGFVPESISSALPARLQDDGKLKLQARAGNWTLEIRGRMMSPLHSLKLPEAATREEAWSLSAHNELRVLNVSGVAQVDPKQVSLPDAWRQYPAYLVKPGDTMTMVETRRGNPTPNPDQLTIAREIWLDFDGGGYTVRDAIRGHLSRSWRLEMASPGELGRASVDGGDQPITRLKEGGPAGIEVRHGSADIRADSRVSTNSRTFPVSGWRVDFDRASAVLNLPPGWRLLHASGVDAASDSWVSQWTLWDFFFVLLSALAAGKLIGWRTGMLVGVALAVSWHMPGAPQALWLVLLALHTLTEVLPPGSLLQVSTWGARSAAVVIALVLLPYGVEQVRLSMYPSLEQPGLVFGEQATLAQTEMRRAAAPSMAEKMPQELDETVAGDAAPARDYAKGRISALNRLEGKYAAIARLDEVDPGTRVQTGPGLPGWRWNAHELTWQGPAEKSQEFSLTLLPPAGTAALRVGSVVLMIAALLAVIGRLPKVWWRRASSTASAILFSVALLGAHDDVWAEQPRSVTPARASSSQTLIEPSKELLDELRSKLSTPPDCMPACAGVSRMFLLAEGSQIRLRMEVHALADVALPLPGQGTNWRPSVATIDGSPAVLRRDDAGALWVSVRTGVSQIVLDGQVGDASNVEIALPMPVRELKSQITGWTLAGLDARGLPSGALSLSRAVVARDTEDRGTQRDSLPPFLRVERILHLGLRWTMETRVSRMAPSRAPALSRIRLVDGEEVNDTFVRVENGHAIVQLGTEDAATFVSTLKEAPKVELRSTDEPHQIEIWKLDASTQWHVTLSGIAPVLHQEGARWMPTWQPWPSESIAVSITKPLGVAGQTMTIDRVNTTVTPGQRATDVSSDISLRSSQGGNHTVTLPDGAELMAVKINGRVQPIQAQGRSVALPIIPGTHQITLDWRQAHGMGLLFESDRIDVGAPGVNDAVAINVPRDRVVLAAGGPVVGPAVLFWGVLIPVLAIAIALGRSRLAPLSASAWFLLGLGIAQTSLWGAAAMTVWFILLALRKRLGTGVNNRVFAAVQVGLVAWTVLAAIVLLDTVRAGLLGYPDMMILGNGSGAWHLSWYQDRLAGETTQAWVITIPVLTYRLLMLLWALWLAASLLKWIKWAWECFSVGGYWRAKPFAKQASSNSAALATDTDGARDDKES